MTYFILWACLTTSPGRCAYEPMQAFATLVACQTAEGMAPYRDKETKCLPDHMKLNPNGTIR
jgi:hypothetical protein